MDRTLRNKYITANRGMSGTAIAGQTTDIELTMTETLWLQGAELILKGQAVNDSIDFVIVHPTLGDVGEFGLNYQVCTDTERQGKELAEYLAKIDAGLKVVIRYKSTGTESVTVKARLYFHKEK